MKIGIISDLHSNVPALHAVLGALDQARVDAIYCLGDIINPLDNPDEIIQILREREIPCLRGNHEDYFIDAITKPESPVGRLPQFRTTRLSARFLSPTSLEWIRSLPSDLRLGEHSVFLCHASPWSNREGYVLGVPKERESDIRSTGSKIIVSGHWHRPATLNFETQTLVSVGSVGIPFQKKPHAEYFILTLGREAPKFEHLSTPFDAPSVAKNYLQSGLVEEGGPISWMLYDELRCNARRLAPFFIRVKERGLDITTDSALETAAVEFLREVERWAPLQETLPFLK